MFSKTNRINIAFYNQAWMFLDHDIVKSPYVLFTFIA